MKVYKYLSVLVITLAQRSRNTEFAVISDIFENQTCETYQLFARCKYEGVHSIVNQLPVLCLCVWQCLQLGLLWGLGFCPPRTSITLAPFTVSGKFVLSFWAFSCSVSKAGGNAKICACEIYTSNAKMANKWWAFLALTSSAGITTACIYDYLSSSPAHSIVGWLTSFYIPWSH